MARQLHGPRRVGFLREGVLAAIDLDCEFPRRAGEVHDALSHRMLAAEFPRLAFGAERVRQALLRIGGLAAQAAGRDGSITRRHWPHLTPALSAPQGAERECRRTSYARALGNA
jgi:hypothetical protein